ncbi:Fes1-domain-containing protein [Thozetella sp. PMI_491]|nr:Fes1-domain-containing protein [Thozetella sp. PMI_491]
MDSKLNDLLRWSIENTDTAAANRTTAASDAAATAESAERVRNLDPELLAAIMGGPSDADLMKEAISVVTNPDPEVTLENKMIAFDNLEQLIENLDNANNMEKLALWTPLLDLLDHEEHDLRRMAAWCVGTAVQNNETSQARLLAMGGIPRLVSMAAKDGENAAARRKAIYALSSAVRNYQPAMDAATEALQKHGYDGAKVDAQNMDAVDDIMNGLRDKVPKPVA